MNSYERVMNALQGKAVDRPPVFAVLASYGAKLTNVPLPDYYRNAELYVAGQKAVYEKFGVDLMLATFDYSALAEAFGGEVKFFTNQTPNMRKPVVDDVETALQLENPDIDKDAALSEILKATSLLAAEYKNEVPIIGCVPGPVSFPGLVMGLEKWLETILFDWEKAVELLNKLKTFWIDWVNRLLAAGADILVVTEGMAPANIVTRDLYAEKVLPYDIEYFQELKGPAVFHHTGGNINHIVDLLVDLPNLAAICIGSKDKIDTTRKLAPGFPILGNVDNLTFRSLTPEKMERYSRVCFEKGQQNAPFILCNSGADISVDSSIDTINAYLKPVFENRIVPEKTTWICCGVLKNEIEKLRSDGSLTGEFIYLDSMLHMDPVKLNEILGRCLHNVKSPTVVVYGDCSPDMLQIVDRPGVKRVKAINCCQMLTGRKKYRELMKKDAFMYLPEWMMRWKNILKNELGLSSETACQLLNENRGHFVYLDTGIMAVPEQEIKECSSYTNQEITIEKISLEPFKKLLLEAREEAIKSFSQIK